MTSTSCWPSSRRRTRIATREFKGVDQTKLDGRIEQIRQAWKTKYGHDFDLSDEKTVFDNRYAIVQGEVSDPSSRAGWLPVAITADAVTAGSRQSRGPERQDREK